MENGSFSLNTAREEKGCPNLVSRDFKLESIAKPLTEDSLTVFLGGLRQFVGNKDKPEQMQARECTRLIRPISGRLTQSNDDSRPNGKGCVSGRSTGLVDTHTLPTQKGGNACKRSRTEVASENAFSSEGSNKTASGDHPKNTVSRRLEGDSLISMIGAQQVCSAPEGPIIIGSEGTSGQSRERAVTKAQADWETHIRAMEQVLMTNRAQGLPSGPISEEALDLLSQMVSKLHELNSKVMYVKMQDVMDTHRRNTDRIESVFHGLAGVNKPRGCSGRSSSR